MKRNKQLLLKTAKHIESDPASYAQYTYFEDGSCGSIACLAGWILICSKPTVEQGIKFLRRLKNPGITAERLAGLTFMEGCRIFTITASLWPYRFQRRYYLAKSRRGKANAAAALLRYLAEDGVV